MFGGEPRQIRILVAVAASAAGLVHVSISASQFLFGVGIALYLIFRQKLRIPRIWIPLAALLFWTVVADALSADPWGGRAQLKKLVIFLVIPFLFGVFVTRFSYVRY